MFRKIFGKSKQASFDATVEKAQLLDAAVENARETNPLAHLKIGADELVHQLLSAMKTEHGVHIESILAAIGSLAGFCCIDSTLKQVAATGGSPRDHGIVEVATSDGGRYYFGDPINKLLGGTDLSLWALIAGMVNHLGSQDYPDFAAISQHVAGTVGTPQFGHPRTSGHQPGDLPITYVRGLWPHVLPLLERRVPVLQERVTLFGFAVQNIMNMGKDTIAPAVAGKLVMECAVPMSKLDPAALST